MEERSGRLLPQNPRHCAFWLADHAGAKARFLDATRAWAGTLLGIVQWSGVIA